MAKMGVKIIIALFLVVMLMALFETCYGNNPLDNNCGTSKKNCKTCCKKISGWLFSFVQEVGFCKCKTANGFEVYFS